MEKHTEVKLSEEILRSYEQSRETWIEKVKKNEDFARGNQWTEIEKQTLLEKNQFPIVVNTIQPAVQSAVAMLTSNKPKFSSTAKEDSDTKTGQIMSALMSHIWDGSDGNQELKITAEDAYVKSAGYIQVYYDPHADFGKGEIYLKSLDPYDVFPDPNSKGRYLEDSANIIVSKVLSREQALRTYPEIAPFADQMEQVSFSKHPMSHSTQDIEALDNYHKHYELIDRYTKVKITRYKIFEVSTQTERVLENEQELKEFMGLPAVIRITEQGQEYVLREDLVNQDLTFFEETGGEIFYIEQPTGDPSIPPQPQMIKGNPFNEDGSVAEGYISGSYLRVVPVSMGQLMQEGVIQLTEIYQDRIKNVLSIGGVLVFNGFLGNLEDYPIKRLLFRYDRTAYPDSDVDLVKDLQRYVNKTRSLIMAHASNNTNIKVLVPRGSVDKENFEKAFSKAGTAVLEVDMEIGTPVIVQPQPLPNELYANEAQARRDIQEILGIYAMSQGDAQASPSTYRGILTIDEFGQRRIKSRKDDIEGFLNEIGKVVLQFIQMCYTEYKAVRIIKPNNLDTYVEINKPIYADHSGSITGRLNDVTVGRYDLIVVSGSMLPSNRWALLEYYTDLYEKGIIDQEEVLKKTEVADMEGVLDRFSQIKALQGQLEQAVQQIEALQGDMQTLQRENVHLKQAVEVEKFKMGMKTVANKAEASKMLYEQRTHDELKMIKRENQLQRNSKNKKDK